jgi:uncharacterized protein YcbK (DUF882 family)
MSIHPKDPIVRTNLYATEAARPMAWNGAIGITSWFRPPEVNAEVGGAPFSQHLTGGAADCFTMDGRDDEFETWLALNWGGGLGYGVRSGLGFTHLDMRAGGFQWGDGSIRWDY